MKVTIELPDDLYRKVKSQAALKGRSVREVTAELYRVWLGESSAAPDDASAGTWLDNWVSLGEETLGAAVARPNTRDVLSADRSRLDRK